MKQSEINTLRVGDKVTHKRYGTCEVVDMVPGFGPVILPLSPVDRRQLSTDYRTTPDCPLLETTNRMITGRVTP
jgi:hypothetical protein